MSREFLLLSAWEAATAERKRIEMIARLGQRCIALGLLGCLLSGPLIWWLSAYAVAFPILSVILLVVGVFAAWWPYWSTYDYLQRRRNAPLLEAKRAERKCADEYQSVAGINSGDFR